MVHKKPLVDMGSNRSLSRLQDLSFNSLLSLKLKTSAVNNHLRYITLLSLRVIILHLTYLKGLEIPELKEGNMPELK